MRRAGITVQFGAPPALDAPWPVGHLSNRPTAGHASRRERYSRSPLPPGPYLSRVSPPGWSPASTCVDRGSGTVSGTGLYEVSGFGPLAIAGSLDVAKGCLGPLLAGSNAPCWRPWPPRRPSPATTGRRSSAEPAAGGSPPLWVPPCRGPGGPRFSAAAWPAEGCFVRPDSDVWWPWSDWYRCFFMRRRVAGAGSPPSASPDPIIAKRLAGNDGLPQKDRARVLVSRLLFDRDPSPSGDDGVQRQPRVAGTPADRS